MSLFARKQPEPPRRDPDAEHRAIGDFWAWWRAAGAAETAASIEARDSHRMIPVLTGRVEPIAPGLAWGLAPGTRSEHVLIVTAEGNPDLRAAAHRWLEAAPASDGLWDYAAARPADPNPADVVIGVAGVQVDVASATVAITETRSTLDVSVHHPALAALPHTPRMTGTFLLLDHVLGENAVETWIGVIEGAQRPLAEAVPLLDLPDRVGDLVAACTTADGEPAWGVAQIKGPMGSIILVSAQVPLKAATGPRFDTHVSVALDFRTPAIGNGLPEQPTLDALRAYEDRLVWLLGDDGRIVAHKTHAGRRTISFYVDGTTDAAERLRVAAASWSLGKQKVKAWYDPSWEQVAELRL
jgi:hypothetical protein